MDTNPYSNILKALGASTTPANGSNPAGGLSYEQQAQNYSAFSELMKQGVSLPDLISKIEALESKVKSIEENPSQSKINQELFEVMESAVRSDPAVKEAKQRMSDIKSSIITEMCIRDPRYKEAYDGYRTAVNAAYIRSKEEQASDREGGSEVRANPSGSISHQEDDESAEEA